MRTLPSSPTSRRFALNLFVAFLPIAVVGFLFSGWIKTYLFSPFTVAAAVVVGGVVILLIERWRPPTPIEDVDDVPVRTALGIGLLQVLALVPGTSRAGATIMDAYALGCSRRAATEFSFFLALPVMLAATDYELWDSRDLLTASEVPFFAVGFVVLYLSALVVVRLFLRFVSDHTFVPFAWYRIVLGGGSCCSSTASVEALESLPSFRIPPRRSGSLCLSPFVYLPFLPRAGSSACSSQRCWCVGSAPAAPPHSSS